MSGACTLPALSEHGAAGPQPPHLLSLTPPSATSALSVPSPHGVFVKPSPASSELSPVPQNSGNSYPAVGLLGFTESPVRHGTTCWQAQLGTILFPDTGEAWGLLVYFVRVYVCARACAKSLQWFLTLCNHMHYSRQAPLSMGFSRQEYWSWLPCPPPGDLPNPGVEPSSLMSPALASRFFTTSATWEGPQDYRNKDKTLRKQCPQVREL